MIDATCFLLIVVAIGLPWLPLYTATGRVLILPHRPPDPSHRRTASLEHRRPIFSPAREVSTPYTT